MRTSALTGIALLFLVAARLPAQTEEDVALSPRNANYTIDVRLDPETQMLHGKQTVLWRNIQDRPTNRLWFHLYWNGWRNNKSTWMKEDRLRGRSRFEGEKKPEDWSYLEVDSMRLPQTGEDISRTMYFAFPDDRNVQDRTVMVALLPQPVEPGASIEVELEWHAKIPRPFARTGRRGDFYFIAHWFPKLGVFERSGWNCHQYHSGTEFYSDYGVYDVSITLPERFVVGATGREEETTRNADGTVTHRFVQPDVHAFTWTASPDFEVVEEPFSVEGLPPVDIRLLVLPDHFAQASRLIEATKVALESYGRWYGPYPYGHVTVVDPAWKSDAGGMEYPTLFTAGSRWNSPFGGGRPEGVTIHEAGHQFWYGIVGNNEFEAAWLDEGLNTFSTIRAQHAAYGESDVTFRFLRPPGVDDSGFLALKLDGFNYAGDPFAQRRSRFRADAVSDDQSTPSFRYHPRTGSSLSYSKTALWLATLENWLGWDALQSILSGFFEKWKFGHPTATDFIDFANQQSEADIRRFLDDVMSSATFDYAIDKVSTYPAGTEGWVKTKDELRYRDGSGPPDSDPKFRGDVVVRRLGSGTFPVEVLLVFEDGHEERKRWPGRQRWKLFSVEHTARLAYAEVDPDGVLALDLVKSNNSMRVESSADLPAWKWAARWTAWFSDFVSSFSFFV